MHDRSRSGRPATSSTAPIQSGRISAVVLLFVLLLAGLVATSCGSMKFPEEPSVDAKASQEASPAAAGTADRAAPAAGSTTDTSPGWAELSRQGRDGMRIADYVLAEDRYVAALRTIDDLPASDVRVQTSLRNLTYLARRLQVLNEYVQAGRVIEILIEESKRGRTAEPNEFTALLLVQGQHIQSEGEVEQAIGIYELALGLHDPASGEASTNLLLLRQSLGSAYVDLERYDEALPLLIDVADELEAAQGADSPLYAAALNDLARAYLALGQLREAEDVYRRSQEIHEASGPRSLQAAVTSNALAWVLLEQGRNFEALGEARSALAILEELKIQGAVLAAALDTLATAEARTQSYVDAEAHYRLAIAEREKASPALKRELAVVFVNYASMLRELDRASEAEALEARAQLELQ